MLKKLLIVPLLFALTVPAHAFLPPIVVPPPVVHPPPAVGGGGGGGGGAGAVGGVAAGIIIVAAVLAGYDFARRFGCIGDPWHLGGPGFGEPMPTSGNIATPAYMRGGCGVPIAAPIRKHKRQRHIVSVRG